jgi:iron uptake system EfeUOB component EfeO/EfeM
MSRLLPLLALLLLPLGCAVDARTAPALAEAAASGPVRDYASAQADSVAATALLLAQQAVPPLGAAADLDAAQQSWRKARAGYDRGVAVFLVVAPELDFELDGHSDDPLATSGLRQLERALFATPPATAELAHLTAGLSQAARALHVAVSGRPIAAASLVAALSAIAGQLAGKLDGSISPYAGAALLSAESNLRGLQALYAPLAPLVQGIDPLLDQRIADGLQLLLDELRSLPTIDAAADKPLLLRQCAALSQSLGQLAAALGLTASAINLS